MERSEYSKMYVFENDYWWYKGLHELVRYYVSQFRDETHSGGPGGSIAILDAGCGTGRLMQILETYGTVEGCDYSEDALKLCRERGLTRIRKEDLNAWIPPEHKYDIIISNDVICTLGVEDDMRIVRKFHVALKPEGMLILNLPAYEMLRRKHDIAVSGKRRYRRNATMAGVREMGFAAHCVTYRLPALFCFLVFQKYIIERFAKDSNESDLRQLPPFLNGFLLAMNRFENRMIAAGVPFPFGSSLFLVLKAEKQNPRICCTA